MAIWNFGSINIDNIYSVPHLPGAGETLASSRLSVELGGKGANQSVAASRAGSKVFHIGAIGPDTSWVLDRLKDAEIDVENVAQVDEPTGHAIIAVDSAGENSIILYSGANLAINPDFATSALSKATEGDHLLIQNETGNPNWACAAAKAQGLHVIYSVAPFDLEFARDAIEYADTLVLNAVEVAQLEAALGSARADLGLQRLIVTKGSEGVELYEKDRRTDIAAIRADVVDTTGAGDCFSGYFAAGLDQGLDAHDAARLAVAAASLQVEKPGTSAAIPMRDEVEIRLNRA